LKKQGAPIDLTARDYGRNTTAPFSRMGDQAPHHPGHAQNGAGAPAVATLK